MNTGRIQSLFDALDEAVEILAENRTPDSVCVRAFDTLKQARALVARAFPQPAVALNTESMGDAAMTRSAA